MFSKDTSPHLFPWLLTFNHHELSTQIEKIRMEYPIWRTITCQCWFVHFTSHLLVNKLMPTLAARLWLIHISTTIFLNVASQNPKPLTKWMCCYRTSDGNIGSWSKVRPSLPQKTNHSPSNKFNQNIKFAKLSLSNTFNPKYSFMSRRGDHYKGLHHKKP